MEGAVAAARVPEPTAENLRGARTAIKGATVEDFKKTAFGATVSVIQLQVLHGDVEARRATALLKIVYNVMERAVELGMKKVKVINAIMDDAGGPLINLMQDSSVDSVARRAAERAVMAPTRPERPGRGGRMSWFLRTGLWRSLGAGGMYPRLVSGWGRSERSAQSLHSDSDSDSFSRVPRLPAAPTAPMRGFAFGPCPSAHPGPGCVM